jgi:hypothetical protein
MAENTRNRHLTVGNAVAALAIMITPATAGADPDLEAARAYGVKQPLAQRVNREPGPALNRTEVDVVTPVVPSVSPKSPSDSRIDLKAEADSVRQSVQRISDLTSSALADYDRASFEARLDASLAAVKAWLDHVPAASPALPAAEDSATHDR